MIVLENIINKLELILELHRSRDKVFEKRCTVMGTMIDRHDVDDDKLQTTIDVMKERFP